MFNRDVPDRIKIDGNTVR